MVLRCTGLRALLGCALSVGLLTACADVPEDAVDEVGASSEALRLRVERRSIAYDWASRDAMPHGVAGDERFVFLTEPLTGRVVALSRYTGRELGELPAPPGGFVLPFALRSTGVGGLAVLDPGGLPDPTAPPPTATIHEYEYRWDRRARRFEATWVRTLPLTGAITLFVEDFEVLPDGSYVVSESILGALWIVEPDGTVRPGVVPAGFAPSDAIPGLGPCAFPAGVTVDGIPFEPHGMFAPGVGFLASDDTFLYFGNTCAGGIRRIPVASLSDARPPHERGDDIELVSPPPAGAAVDVLKGLVVDRYRDPNTLYAVDALRLEVLRVDLTTGARERVAGPDAVLFDFPVAMELLPPVFGISPLVVVSDQEHRWTGINAALTEDRFRLPFVVAKVIPLHRR